MGILKSQKLNRNLRRQRNVTVISSGISCLYFVCSSGKEYQWRKSPPERSQFHALVSLRFNGMRGNWSFLIFNDVMLDFMD